MREYFLKEANFNKSKVSLIFYCKSLISLKEIKKPSGKFLHVELKTN